MGAAVNREVIAWALLKILEKESPLKLQCQRGLVESGAPACGIHFINEPSMRMRSGNLFECYAILPVRTILGWITEHQRKYLPFTADKLSGSVITTLPHNFGFLSPL
jgi:hypothetical protein